MRILIIGVHHELQSPGQTLTMTNDLPAAEMADKAQFKKLLTKLITKRHVSIVGEEQLAPRETIPRKVANSLGVRHEYVEMSREERAARGIPENYSLDKRVSAGQVQAYHRQREAYWVSRIEDLAPPNASCLLVCGRDHLGGVSDLLKRHKHEVEVLDVEKLDDYDLRWIGERLYRSLS